MPGHPRCSTSEPKQSFNNVTFDLVFHDHDIFSNIVNKSLTLVIIQKASAPRDSGQTVWLHKLTGQQAREHSSRLRNKTTDSHIHIHINIKTHKHDAFLGHGSNPTWQLTFSIRRLHVPLTVPTGMPPRPLCLSPTS